MEIEAGPLIKIAAVGMDERSIARMATLFRIIYKGRCEFAQGDDAILGMVDLDSGPNTWDEFRQQYPTLPAVIMSESPVSVGEAIYVAKPARLNVLWDAIFSLVTGLPLTDDIASKADSAAPPVSTPATPESGESTLSVAASAMGSRIKTAVSSSTAVQRNNSEDEATGFYNSNDYLLGNILSILNEHAGRQCAIHMHCWKDRQLILFPYQGRVHTDLTASQLKNLGVAAFKGCDLNIKNTSSADTGELSSSERAGFYSISIDHLMWDLALRTARGRVPEGTDLSAQYYLQRWPNFPRLPHTAHSMRIASLWVGNPRTLDDIAANLDIERADVYSFYSAAAVVGLTGSVNRKVDTLVAPREAIKKEPSRRGFFASILRHMSKQGRPHE